MLSVVILPPTSCSFQWSLYMSIWNDSHKCVSSSDLDLYALVYMHSRLFHLTPRASQRPSNGVSSRVYMWMYYICSYAKLRSNIWNGKLLPDYRVIITFNSIIYGKLAFQNRHSTGWIVKRRLCVCVCVVSFECIWVCHRL